MAKCIEVKPLQHKLFLFFNFISSLPGLGGLYLGPTWLAGGSLVTWTAVGSGWNKWGVSEWVIKFTSLSRTADCEVKINEELGWKIMMNLMPLLWEHKVIRSYNVIWDSIRAITNHHNQLSYYVIVLYCRFLKRLHHSLNSHRCLLQRKYNKVYIFAFHPIAPSRNPNSLNTRTS